MQSILDLSKTNKLILAAFTFLTMLTYSGGRAHAATLDVTGGCTLPIAIDSVNAGANQSGCTATGASYGTSDTITIPAGTITLAADLPLLTQDVEIKGAGIGSTIIDGDSGQYKGIYVGPGSTISISDLKIVGFNEYAITARTDESVRIDRVEVDGSDAQFGGSFSALRGVFIINSSSSTRTVNVSDLYVHDLNAIANVVAGLLVDQDDGGTTNATLQNITVAGITNNKPTNGGAIGVFLSVGVWGSSFGSFGTLNTTATNITIDEIHSNSTTAAAFSNNAYSDNGNATVNTTINSVTVTNTDGIHDTFSDVDSAAFYAVSIGVGAGTTASSIINVGNSLMAHNLSDGNSSNCVTGDFTSLVGGAGTGVTSVGSLGHNMLDDTTCASNFTDPTDYHGVVNIFTTLGDLKDNGGAVPTRALLAGSPAIAAGGQVLGVTTDARGVARPTTCPSVGAFQFEGAVCAATTTNANTNAGNAAAPNTGVKPSALLVQIIVGLLGIGALAYAARSSIHRES